MSGSFSDSMMRQWSLIRDLARGEGSEDGVGGFMISCGICCGTCFLVFLLAIVCIYNGFAINIGLTHPNVPACANDMMGLDHWLVIGGSVGMSMGITLLIVAACLILGACMSEEPGAFFGAGACCAVCFYCAAIIFNVVWFGIGVSIMVDVSEGCKVAARPVWDMAIAFLVFQGLGVLGVVNLCCFARGS